VVSIEGNHASRGARLQMAKSVLLAYREPEISLVYLNNVGRAFRKRVVTET
jgi:hypothetical protein